MAQPQDHIALSKTGRWLGGTKGFIIGVPAAIVAACLMPHVALIAGLGVLLASTVWGVVSGGLTGWIGEHIFGMGKNAQTAGQSGRALGMFKGIMHGLLAGAAILAFGIATGGMGFGLVAAAAGAAIVTGAISTLGGVIVDGLAAGLLGFLGIIKKDNNNQSQNTNYNDAYHAQKRVPQYDQSQTRPMQTPGKSAPGVQVQM